MLEKIMPIKKNKSHSPKTPYQEVLEQLPPHLRLFAVDQDYHQYTPIDQASWRYIMLNHKRYFATRAFGHYTDWLKKTGITIEEIPTIDHLNSCLQKLGWRAVIVNGFIPPAIFMEFQEHKIFPVSAEMRSVHHLLYTPAPDIVHEVAGHIPIVADKDYAEFLQKIGEIGGKAISTQRDMDVYEAIRKLSIVKEWPAATDQDISQAEAELKMCLANNPNPSEATRMSRFHWWTVEYGLIGTLENPKIYGAGILSSMGESRTCFDSKVKKIWLTPDCAHVAYDITKEQPQLFVVRDWAHLHQVLEEFAETLSFRKGGLSSLKLAKDSQRDATVVYSSGLQVSGTLTEILEQNDEAIYLQFSGPTSLSFNHRELKGQGIEEHAKGFGSPVGNLKGCKRPWENLNVQELTELGIEEGKTATLEFVSGIKVQGLVKEIKRKENKKIILIIFDQVTCWSPDQKVLFSPEWGRFDMAVGCNIISVFSGPADREKYSVRPHKSVRNAVASKFSENDKILFKAYERLHRHRHHLERGGVLDLDEIYQLSHLLHKQYPNDWPLRWEILEVLTRYGTQMAKGLKAEVMDELEQLKKVSPQQAKLIDLGLELLLVDGVGDSGER